MAALQTMVGGSSIEQWLVGVGFAVGAFLLSVVVHRYTICHLGRLAQKTATHVGDLVIGVVRRTRVFFLAILGLYCGTVMLALPPSGLRIVQLLLVLGLLVQAAIWGNVVICFCSPTR